MKLITDVGADGGYGEASASHMAASESALIELAHLVTTDLGQRGARPLYVRLSHFEHGAFLSPLLFGFGVLSATGEIFTGPVAPGMEDKERLPAAVLRSPGGTSPEHPFVYAVVANHPVWIQIEHTLANLASLLARQEFVSGDPTSAVSEIDRLTGELDTRAVTAVSDTLRAQGWRAAAKAISARSRAAGFQLVVNYEPILMDRAELARRLPVLRRVYNELPAAREAVDKIATMLSQGLMTVGGGTQHLAAFARDLLDVGSYRTYLAHLARDAFVCGNGYLSLGTVPDEDMRLLPPESVTILGPKSVSVSAENKKVIHTNVLHVTGAEQRGSPYGLSVLEPFVKLQHERETARHLLDIAEAWERTGAPEPFKTDMLGKVPLANRMLASAEDQITMSLGGPRTIRVTPPTDLYFPGFEHMGPAADGIYLADNELFGGTGREN